MALRVKRANDPLRYLSRRERREYVRALAERQLSEANEAYYERLEALVINTPIGVSGKGNSVEP